MSDTKKAVEQEEISLKGRTILVVNTGWKEKRFTLQRLKKLGLRTVVLNREKNWADSYVDHWIIVDTGNHTASLQAVKSFISSHPEIVIGGVITFWEDDVLLAAKIVDRFHFVGISYNIAKNVRNKFLFRSFCEANHLPAPKHQLLKTDEDVKQIQSTLAFPVVIKPAYGACSEFVVRVDEPKDLPQYVQLVRQGVNASVDSSTTDGAASSLADGTDIFVEEYLDGDEVDIDILVQNGKIKFSSISDNFDKKKDIFFIDRGQAVPSSLPTETQESLLFMAEEVLEKLGIQNGCIHMEAMAMKKGPVPIEVNLRMGGDYVYSYTKDAWGVDLIEESVKIAFGIYISPMRLTKPKRYMIGWDIHPDRSGILVESSVDEDLLKRPYLRELDIHREIGDPILVPPQGHSYIGWVTVSGHNMLDAQDNLKTTLDAIHFSVVPLDPESSLGKTSRTSRLSEAVLNKELLLKKTHVERLKRVSFKDQRSLRVGLAYDLSAGAYPVYRMEDVHACHDALVAHGYAVVFLDFTVPGSAIMSLRRQDIDLVVNVSRSAKSQIAIASLCQLLDVPYTGPSQSTLTYCLDKMTMRKMLAFHNIPLPAWDYLRSADDILDEEFTYPVIMKSSQTNVPRGVDESALIFSEAELRQKASVLIAETHHAVVIEEFVQGDEYDVCIFGNRPDDYRVLPLARYRFQSKGDLRKAFFSNQSREPGKQSHIHVERPPKKLSTRLEALLSEIALDTYRLLECRGYGRVVLRIDAEGNPYVLEVNPSPALRKDSPFIEVAKLVGMSFSEVLEEVIWLALEEFRSSQR